eukprot:6695143-Pyramimonas_sp.AAC.1
MTVESSSAPPQVCVSLTLACVARVGDFSMKSSRRRLQSLSCRSFASLASFRRRSASLRSASARCLWWGRWRGSGEGQEGVRRGSGGTGRNRRAVRHRVRLHLR